VITTATSRRSCDADESAYWDEDSTCLPGIAEFIALEIIARIK